ncbi:probable NIT-4 pathway-specific regulatory protein nit-4 [Cephalotrichum gorgonifer]|uniref:Probable NIT-4 pathway-specific regulatory protein nit-4 n=1 Tax=Cephalotrichum gorgonifer TaxID=2041049 RepID=A0AAE8MU97_9PEZI|nr:probable NIT-4 pathway-specific regulatory protein nit-4 [Cephalotrichum gorgonifer]
MDSQMAPPTGPSDHLGPDPPAPPATGTKKKARRNEEATAQKRRCVSTACIACRRRKSKCDGALPSCAACASVYGTECVYDPNSDHRRKGVYREKTGNVKARNTTLHVLLDAIINASEDDVFDLVNRVRTADSLDAVAESILNHQAARSNEPEHVVDSGNESQDDSAVDGERDLARKMGELRLENGMVRFIGGTSHLIHLGSPTDTNPEPDAPLLLAGESPITSWTNVTKDPQLVVHLINMYFNWHYPYFTTLSKRLFYQDFLRGRQASAPHCSSLLVNAMLALGCHFTDVPGACAVAGESKTKGDHFFAEAKKLIVENDEYEKPRLTTVQALALMSVREAGCAREAKGWVYSGMSFRMAQDIGLNFNGGSVGAHGETLTEHEIDARRITFWGCFLFDKCWSNYLGRLPQIPQNTYSVPKYDVFPDEDAEMWSPYTDNGFDQTSTQASRTRAVGLELSKLSEISSDLLIFFYHPSHIGMSSGKSVELKKLSELHRRLEEWRQSLPKEFEPRDGQLPNVILMHMFFHLQYIHLFRPFLKYTPEASPLPSHVSPRRICTANAIAISKLIRLYKKSWNLRQICNIAVYMVHSACTIHLLNLPEKTSKRDIIHGVKHLEEIAEDWLCARRTLGILSVLSRKWNCELPEEARVVLQRTDEKYGTFSTAEVPSPSSGVSPAAADAPSPEYHASLQPEQQYPPMMTYEQLRNRDHMMRQAATTALNTPTSLPPLSATGQQQQQQQQQHQQHQQRSLPLPVSSQDLSSDWGPPLRTTPTLPPTYRRHPSFPPIRGPSSAVTSSRTSRSTTRNVSPNILGEHAIDGQNWYLNDGVRWHQNFESWAIPPGTSAGGGAGGSVSGGGSSTGNLLARSPAVPEQFTFRRVEDGYGLDPMNMGSGWLSGLD